MTVSAVGTGREMAEGIGKARDVQKMSGRRTKNVHLPCRKQLFLYSIKYGTVFALMKTAMTFEECR